MTNIGALARRLIDDVWNGGDESAAHDLVDPGYVGEAGAGPDGYLAWHRDRRAAFPDQRFAIVSLVAEGDTVAVRWRGSGTQRGPFGPVPPTGRRVEYDGATFMRFANGRVVENWSVNDLFSVLRQLGVVVTPPSGS